MPNPNDVEALLNALPKDEVTGGLNTTPTLKLGDSEVPFDPAKIQEAFDRLQQQNRQEIEQLRTIVQQNVVRPQQADLERPQQYAPPTKTNAYDVDTWAKDTLKDPGAATERAIGEALGLGPNIRFRDVMNSLAANQVEMGKKLQKSEQEKLLMQRDMAQQRFLDSTPDYEVSPKNADVLYGYVRGLRLNEYDPESYKLAYLKATYDGKLTAAEAAHQTNNQQYAAPQRTGVPSLRGTGTGSSMEGLDINEVTRRLNKGSADDAIRWVNELAGTLGVK